MALKEQVLRDGQEVTVLGQDLAKSGVRPFQQCAPFVLRPAIWVCCRDLLRSFLRYSRTSTANPMPILAHDKHGFLESVYLCRHLSRSHLGLRIGEYSGA